jgi:hypothetical protein
VTRTGLFFARRQVVVLPASRADGFLTTRDAARLIGVRPVTIRQWRARGWLVSQGLDEHGYPLHTPEAVREAERQVCARGIKHSAVNPRQIRKGYPREGA